MRSAGPGRPRGLRPAPNGRGPGIGWRGSSAAREPEAAWSREAVQARLW